MEVTGKIVKILPIETGQKKDGSGEWKKQLFLVDNNESYNNIHCFEIFGEEKVDNFNKFNKLNDVVKVLFNISTNEWQGKYFTSLQSWRIEKAEMSNNISNQSNQSAANLNNNNEPDDLPF